VPYDGDNLQHQQQLQELWSLAFPALPFPASIKSNQWKEMGWQVGATATQRVQLLGTAGTVRPPPATWYYSSWGLSMCFLSSMKQVAACVAC
jgi:hypothetical protein